MGGRTVILRQFQAAGLFSAACILLAAAPAKAAIITTYSNVAAFQGALKASYVENFDNLPLGENVDPITGEPAPMSFTNGKYSYSVDAPGDALFILNDPMNETNEMISTETEDADLVFKFNPGIDAVGGDFFPTDITGAVIAGSVTIKFDDGTTKTITVDPTVGAAFTGFVSNVDIASITIGTGSITGTNFVTVDNFYVGGTAPNVVAPEPQSIFLLLGGLSAGALLFRRRYSSQKV
jgi:hypothetical protein